jgi:Flp pilus assembly protein TadB
MSLSDEERRLLTELEDVLTAQDPCLARNLQAAQPSGPDHRRLVLAILVFLAGLALVIIGVATQIALIGVAGFALECAAAYWFLSRANDTQAQRRQG